MKKIAALCIVLAGALKAFAGGDTVIVHKDSRLDVFSAKQAYVNKVSSRMTSSGLYKGYRIQVLSTRSRDDAYKTKAMLLQNFNDQKSYVLFQSPNFKVRVGNFTEKGDAEKFKKEIAHLFKQNIYVVDDLIEYIPKPDELEDN